MVNSTSPQAVIIVDITTCQSSVKTGVLVIYKNVFLLFSIIPDSDFLIPTHPSLALCEKDREECHRQSLLSNPFATVVMTPLDGVNGTVCNAQQDQQSLQFYDSRSPSISCLTHWDIIGLVVSI
jgi:hypothetical protein